MGKLKKLLMVTGDYGPRHRLHCLIVIMTALAIDHFTDHHVANLLGIPDGFFRKRFEALYFAPFVIVGLWIAALLNPKRESPGVQ